ncbi:MAG: hypothetical protein LBJ14_10375 [Desulfarculales bacterium]|jgi:prophage antirepressor-like protein|nr:hypothetical protein [Desulfarculales bacterium]
MKKIASPPAVVNNQSKILAHEEFGHIRTVNVNGRIGVVAKDIATAIDVRWNGIISIKHVPDEWRGVIYDRTPFGTQHIYILFEEGLYFFLARSNKPKAMPFQKWLTGEVLPSIRKTGSYGHIPSRPALEAYNNPAFGISTRDLAKIKGQEHRKVMRSVKNLNRRARKSGLNLNLKRGRYLGANGRHYPLYILPPLAWNLYRSAPCTVTALEQSYSQARKQLSLPARPQESKQITLSNSL